MKMWFRIAYLDHGKLWYIENMMGALYCYDFEKKTNEMVCEIHEKFYGRQAMFSYMTSFDNLLFISPSEGNKWLVYDDLRKEMMEYDVENIKETFLCDAKYGDKIFFIGAQHGYIVSYDRNDRRFNVELNIWEEVKNRISFPGIVFRNSILSDGDTIVVPGWQDNYIVKLNLRTRQYEIQDVGEPGDHFAAIFKYHEDVLLLCKKESDKNSYKIRVLCVDQKGNTRYLPLEGDNRSPQINILKDNNILSFDMLRNDIAVIDLQSEEYSTIDIDSTNDRTTINEFGINVSWADCYGNRLFAYFLGDMSLLEFDKNMSIVNKYTLYTNNEKAVNKMFKMNNGIIREDSYGLNLNEYISYLAFDNK